MSIEQRDGGMSATWGTDIAWDGPGPNHSVKSHTLRIDPARSFVIQDPASNAPVVTIYPDGHIDLAPGCGVNKAARDFWGAVARLGLEDATRERLRRWEDLGRRIDSDRSLPRWIADELQNLLK